MASDRRQDPVAGVLGGMGPEATVELMRRVIAATPASDDADHVRMIVDNNPKVPSRLKAILGEGGDDPGPVLADMARGLERIGADYLVLPCNTAHHYIPVIREAVEIPVFDAIDAALDQVQAKGAVRRLGLLASPALRRISLLDTRAVQRGVEIVYSDPSDELVVLAMIKAVKAGHVTLAHRNEYRAAVGRLASRSEALLVACTELSVLGDVGHHGVATFDTLDVMVDEILSRSGHRARRTAEAGLQRTELG